MRRLGVRDAIDDARRVATLIYPADLSGGSGFGFPPPTDQGDIIIADSTPLWSILSHPSAAYQHLESSTSTLSWVTNLTMTASAWIGLGSTAPRMVFASSGGELAGYSAIDIALYSDAGSTEVGRWDGTTGHLDLHEDLHFTDGTYGIIHAAGNTSGYVLIADGTRFRPGTIPVTSLPAHDLLSAYHDDTTANAVTRGSLIYANSTPEWDELDHPGGAGYALTTDATDVAWDQTPTWTGQHTFSNSLNALTDLSNPSNYHVIIRNPANDNGEMVALGFYISAGTNDVGGAIGFVRTGADTQGELRFYTKRSTADATDAVLALTLEETGDATFAEDIILADDNFVGLGSSAGRLIFDDQATDIARFRAAHIFLHNNTADILEIRNHGDVQNTGADILAASQLGIGGKSHAHIFIDADNNEGDRYFSIRHNGETVAGSNELMRINESGNMGIGETSPSRRLHISSGEPAIMIDESDQGSNAKLWVLVASGGQLYGQTRTDADGAGQTWIQVERSGTTIVDVGFPQGNIGIGLTNPGSLMEWDFSTENLEFVDAGSAGATEQDWIEVQVGGNTGYIRVYAGV